MISKKGIILSALGIGVVALIVKNQRAIKTKPDLFIKQKLPGNYDAFTIPPIGIFVSAAQQNNADLLQHELIHWQQYQRMGLLRYYGTYIAQYLSSGYDRMAMELEARANENAFCRAHYTECVRNGKAKTVFNPLFRS